MEDRLHTRVVRVGGVDSGGADDQHREVAGAPGDESEHVPARRVDPVHIVDEQEERLPVGLVGEQFENGECDPEDLRLGLSGAEGVDQRCPVEGRQILDGVGGW